MMTASNKYRARFCRLNRAVVLLLLLALFSACTQGEEPAYVDFSKREEPEQQQPATADSATFP
jgi:hypothetical protein